MKDTYIPPWAIGPLELIKHANEHFLSAGDIDRRVALIGFDNAIEVCIDVFVRLHPQLRGGHEIPKEDSARFLANYHSKIAFFDTYVSNKGIVPDISINEVVWFHSLRNELYHAGNGMVPELHVIEGACAASLSVYKSLFNIDASPLLGIKNIDNLDEQKSHILYVSQNDEMDFLRLYIEFEKELSKYFMARSGDKDKSRRVARDNWMRFTKDVSVPKELNEAILKASSLRTKIVHGDEDMIIDDISYEQAGSALLKAIELIQGALGSSTKSTG